MEKKLKTLIVDDEKKAVALLQELLEASLQFSEIRYAYSASSATTILQEFEPDVVFLDIKMPGTDGFALLREIRASSDTIGIVFVTAYDEFALDAYRNYAFGYLLKPVNRADLSKCISRFKAMRSERSSEGSQPPRIRFNTRTGYFFVDPDDILYCEADGNYSTINTGDKEHLCSLQLGNIQELLPVNGFMRLGRSLIINFKYVASVDRKKYLLLFEKRGLSLSINVSPSQLKELERLQEQ